jgi:hypothetical protein
MPSVIHAAYVAFFFLRNRSRGRFDSAPATKQACVPQRACPKRAHMLARDRVHVPSSRTSAWREPVPGRPAVARAREPRRDDGWLAGPPPPLGAGVACTLANVLEWSAAIGRSSSKAACCTHLSCRGHGGPRGASCWVVV